MLGQRRYDIDWVRVIAIALLMVYHVAIVFQPWGLMIGFMTNSDSWESLWLPMAMLNIWRIPILFFIAGMGIFFSFQNKNWIELLKERGLRIGVPYLFGALVIVPSYLLLLQNYYDWKFQYLPQSSHLWFLGNILCYVLLAILPLHYFKKSMNSLIKVKIRKLFSSPFIFLVVIVCFIMETVIINPATYEMYALTAHGFFLGLLAFIFGILFAFSGERFWNNLIKFRWLYLFFTLLFFYLRTESYFSFPKKINQSIETCLWIFAILAFAKLYFNFSNKTLTYLSKAAYPVYILHMMFLGLSCSFILPLSINVEIKFCLILTGTIVGSLVSFHLIKRNRYLRLIFGIETYSGKVSVFSCP